MIVFYSAKIDGDIAILEDEESRHCQLVLRKSVGDEIIIVDGLGSQYKCIIQQQNKRNTIAQVISTKKLAPQLIKKAIAIAPPKNMSRFENFLERSTEIGITDIYPILCKHSERKVIKEERVQKILISSMKQSLRAYKPRFYPLSPLSEFISTQAKDYPEKYIAHYKPDNPHLLSFERNEKSNLVVIGPEGDFSAQEIKLSLENGYKCVNLSNNRLRTETAAIVACAYICS